MKKLLFVIHTLDGGGAEKVLIDILKHFDYASYEVTLFLEFKEGTYLNDLPNEVRLLALHPKNTIWFERLHRILRTFHCYAFVHALVYKLLFLNLLKEDKTRDDFVHEQHLLIQGRKNVLLMGCGHKGVLNIIRQCPAAPDIVIGGFHLYSPRTGECLPEPVIMDLAANLPDAVYYTGHCTGDKALEILTRELREIHPLMTGTVIEA